MAATITIRRAGKNRAGEVGEACELTIPPHPQHPDIYVWEAVYTDGTSLLEVEGETLHQLGSVDLARVAGFVLHSLSVDVPSYAVTIRPGQSLYFVRRRGRWANEEGEGIVPTTHLLGWTEMRESNRRVRSYMTIMPLGGGYLLQDEEYINE